MIDYQENDINFLELWDSCNSTVFAIVDAHGDNIGEAVCRHFLANYWLAVDEIRGYRIVTGEEIESLFLEPWEQ